MSTQEVGADGNYESIIIGGPYELLPHFTKIRKVKNGVTILPGKLVSGNGETDGEVDLAAAGDGAVAGIELAIKESPFPSSYPTDGSMIIDQGVLGVTAAPTFVETLRRTGLFKVVLFLADQSANTAEGLPLALEADGMAQFLSALYADGTYATDTMIDFVGRCANVVVDVAATDLIIEAYF